MLGLYRLITVSDHERRILVVDDQSTAPPQEDTSFSSTTDTCSSSELISYCMSLIPSDFLEEPVCEPHVNGDLSYLYVRRHNETPAQRRTNNRPPLRIPCWRKGRWKSLT